MLALADATAAMCAVGAFALLGGGLGAFAWGAIVVPIWILLAKLHGLYDHDHRALRHLTADEVPSLFAWSLAGTGATALVLLAAPTASLEFGTALGAWLVAGCSAFVLRAAARGLWRRLVPREHVVIVGTGPVAEATRRKLELFPDIHADIRAEREDCTLADLDGQSAWLDGADRVVLACQKIAEDVLVALLAECRARGVKLSVVPPARGMFGTAVQLNHVAELPVIEYNTWDASRSTLALKRALDVAGAAVALVAFAPVFVLAALAILAESGRPIVFVQLRGGAGGAPFRMYKFRSMVRDAEARLGDVVAFDDLREPVFKLERDPRTTRVGRLLRRWSVDELPQLWNVLKGDMSLVGPRPEEVDLVRRYAPEHRFRLAVRPGLTGPMQVYGRGQLTFEERLAVEREYIENLALGRDVRILAQTFAAVTSRRGAF